jgi:hypothetical protein
MKIFKGQNLLEVSDYFQSNENRKEYLSKIKWKNVFSCVKCAHLGNQIRKDYSRTCNKCNHTEAASANTIFHKVIFGFRKAFFIFFEMSTTTKSLSASYVAARFGFTEKTARLFMHKVREAMKLSENHSIQGKVKVDEFVVGGKEKGIVVRSYDTKKKKAVCTIAYKEEGKVKRMYSLKIDDFSAKELSSIFDKHISKEANINADKWKGYKPLMAEYNIKQIDSEHGSNFLKLHTMIHQVKSWIGTPYSWVSSFNIDGYFAEFCYRLNRSNSTINIFNNLIGRMVKSDKIYQVNLIYN